MLRESARAKVNLTLRVLGRRADGYHALESLVTFAHVGDVVGLEAADAGKGPIETSGPFAGAIDGENLLSRVLDLAARLAPSLRLGRVHLEKNLPVAAGVGGGSSDAAALIRLLQRANAGRPDAIGVDWSAVAAQLGADVPVCLGHVPAMMWGVGANLLPLRQPEVTPAPIPGVLVNPRLPLATRDVFRALAAPTLAREPDEPRLPGFESPDAVAAYMREVGNDLEAPAQGLLPQIATMKAALTAQPGCLHAALSGSGPTCFALYRTDEDAAYAAQAISLAHPVWWVVATQLDFPA